MAWHRFELVRLPAGTPYHISADNVINLPVAMDAYRCMDCTAFGDPKAKERCSETPRRRNGAVRLHAIDGGNPKEENDEQA